MSKRLGSQDPAPLPILDRGDSVFRTVYVSPEENKSGRSMLAGSWLAEQDPRVLYRGLSDIVWETYASNLHSPACAAVRRPGCLECF